MGSSFRFKQFEVRDELSAMKVGPDGVLLGAWVSLELPDSPTGRGQTSPSVLDVGTGTGVIALMLAQRLAAAGFAQEPGGVRIVGIDIDAPSVEEAAANFAASPWAASLSAQLSDFKDFEGSYDFIVCNPPYFTGSLKAPDARRTAARHNAALPQSVLIDGALRCMAPSGRLAVVLPCDEAARLIGEARGRGLFPARICHVSTCVGKKPKRTLVELSRRAVSAPSCEELAIQTSGGDFTPEYRSLTKAFYLKF